MAAGLALRARTLLGATGVIGKAEGGDPRFRESNEAIASALTVLQRYAGELG
jgi:hypothetical protein